jgi:Tol biopolymer transport system component
MRDGVSPTRRMASLMRGPLVVAKLGSAGACLLPRHGPLVVVIGLLLVALAVGGALADPGITERVSVASDGTEGNGVSCPPSIGANGRYVAFMSEASNLVPGDTNSIWDVFVHDRQTGETVRVSVGSDGAQANGRSWRPAISSDERHVAFVSAASNLVVGDTNNTADVFMHDRVSGETTRVSVASDGSQANSGSQTDGEPPAISSDGRYVAFQSSASNLVPGDANARNDIFVRDRTTGETTRVNVASDGTEANGWSWGHVAISGGGRYVAFESAASNLVVGDTNGVCDVFVHDRQTGETTRVSVASDGTQGDSDSWLPTISADGRFVAFECVATNLVVGDTNGTEDIFVHDRTTGETTRVSVASDGAQANWNSYEPAISAAGRYVTFGSRATNLVPDDTNGCDDTFLHDRVTGETTRVSVTSDGAQAGGYCATLSADGRHVALESYATNLVPDDTNGVGDVFVHDRQTSPQLPYQFSGFLPPLHDGTSVTSPDGPFKRGRTIPVKFQLLDSEGQLISDEEAQGLVAELAVFYEEPSNQGDPIDPGDNPGDVGDQFRYDADADLFIYNLSTKALVWYADYTYGLEVLINGIKAADVYFSLR